MQMIASACFGGAALMTYYQGAIAAIICLVWALFIQPIRTTGFRRRHVAIVLIILVALPLLTAAALIPVFVQRHLPGANTLFQRETWVTYPAAVAGLVGPVLLLLGTAGIAIGIVRQRWRREVWFIATWMTTPIVVFSLFPAKDPRYILIVVPAFVLAAALGCACLILSLSRISSRSAMLFLAAGLAFAAWQAAQIEIPQRAGFRAAVSYLRQHAPAEAVFYDGYDDGLFGFYFRASDPQFQRRLVLGQQIIYHYGPARSFQWEEMLNAKTPDDVLHLLRTRSGCQWIAIEVGRRSEWAKGQRLLRKAIAGPAFELVRSFPVIAPGAVRIDLYRLLEPVKPVSTVDVRVASFSDRIFHNVLPISR